MGNLRGKDQSSVLLTVGYVLFKGFPAKIVPGSRWVKARMDSAGMRVSHVVYMSAMFFWTLLMPFLVFVLSLFVLDTASLGFFLSSLVSVPAFMLDPLVMRVLIGLVSAVLTMLVFYTYPLYVSGKIKRELERNLVYITNYTAIMASGGATSEETFASLAKVGKVFGVEQSGAAVIRSVDLLGQDIITALDNESKRTPSKEYGGFLQGFIATVRKGGDLKSYLSSMSEKYIEDRKRLLSKLVTQLNFVAEVFIILLVAFPVIMIVLLTVMESLGGNVLGNLSAMEIMSLMTYLMVPLAALGVVVLIDVMMGNQ